MSTQTPEVRTKRLQPAWSWEDIPGTLLKQAGGPYFLLTAMKESVKVYWSCRLTAVREMPVIQHGEAPTLKQAKVLAELCAEKFVHDLSQAVEGENRWAAISTSTSKGSTKKTSGGRSTGGSKSAVTATVRKGSTPTALTVARSRKTTTKKRGGATRDR